MVRAGSEHPDIGLETGAGGGLGGARAGVGHRAAGLGFGQLFSLSASDSEARPGWERQAPAWPVGRRSVVLGRAELGLGPPEGLVTQPITKELNSYGFGTTDTDGASMWVSGTLSPFFSFLTSR